MFPFNKQDDVMRKVTYEQQLACLNRSIKGRGTGEKILKQWRKIKELEHKMESDQSKESKKQRLCGICRCPGHDKRKCPKKDEIILPEKHSKKGAIDNENKCIDLFNSDIESRHKLCDIFGIPFEDAKAIKPIKENGYHIQNTLDWDKYKTGTKEKSATSKTDICIRSGETCTNISLKSGKGRLTSADCYETNAIFLSVWEHKYSENNGIKIIITEILKLMKQLGKKIPIHSSRSKTSICKEMKCSPELDDEDIIWMKEFLLSQGKCVELWSKLADEYPEYIKDVLYECASGEYKFADNSGRARWLMITKKNTAEIDTVLNLNGRTPELDNYLQSCLPKKGTSIFACKSGGTGKEMWMRFL
tara:strand:- start:1054 stop:2136 length:1083 start_codon:yes stop_codon:yes gene_type:complete